MSEAKASLQLQVAIRCAYGTLLCEHSEQFINNSVSVQKTITLQSYNKITGTRGGDEMKEQKFRHEIKHYINLSDYFALRQRLKVITKADPNVGEDGKYRIRSLYFDNLDDKALREKINGINNREKFRIRYYNQDTSFINLEKKSKINGLCNKQSASVTKKQCEQMVEGNIEWMKDTGNPLLIELYTKMHYQQLKPKTVVDYIREPFIYEPGNVRITIDSKIRTGLHSKDLFNEDLPTMSTDTDGTIILEVKFDEFLPEIIRDIIQTKNRQCSAFSKYAVCRRYG